MAYMIITGISIAMGYFAFWGIYRLLPKRFQADRQKQYDDIVGDARKQALERKSAEAELLFEQHQIYREQIDSEINERREDLKLELEDLEAREKSLLSEEQRVQKHANDVRLAEEKKQLAQQAYEAKIIEIIEIKKDLTSQLENAAQSEAKALLRTMQESLVEGRQIAAQKALRYLDEDLSSSSKRLAQRLMSRVMARYTPEFYWPKSINVVELQDAKLAERITAEGQSLIADLKEKAGIEIEVLSTPDQAIPLVKLAGGAGVDREAARLALTEMVSRGPSTWAKAASFYDKHRAVLEQEAVRLGRQAVLQVQLENVHPELQKLVGYLNWRTSYRQNQWYHTVEVAKLAGILASELGVDIDAAKRCGLLHDVGKALDYRIEGSHAVISGDYADRFGERRIICDTVMSHHNDLVVESPLAYVLRAADTLSGARPGARVNLEEGYQMRLSGIESVVRSFPGVVSLSIMNGAREVHVEVNPKRVQEKDLDTLSQNIARKIEEDVAYPGEIKILVSRRFEATAVA